MSSFRRTISGITNQHLFYNVDLIVFVEGGETSFTKHEIYQGNYNDDGDDVLFWEKMFEKFEKSKKIKFKSIGSKTAIKEIGLDIVNGNISTVMVAMDSEFDEILSKKLQHPNIFYTNGYSWENDVWNKNVIKAVLEELSSVSIEENVIENNLHHFFKILKIGIYADCYLFAKGDSFFPRKGYMSCVNCQPKDLPTIKKEVFNTLFKNRGLKVTTLYSYAKRKRININMMCFGHLLADYCFQLIMHYLKNRLKLPGINKIIVNRMAISKYFNNYFEVSDCLDFYKNQFARLIP